MRSRPTHIRRCFGVWIITLYPLRLQSFPLQHFIKHFVAVHGFLQRTASCSVKGSFSSYFITFLIYPHSQNASIVIHLWTFFYSQELQIPFSQYEHPVVLTVDAQVKPVNTILYLPFLVHFIVILFLIQCPWSYLQAQYVGHLGGGLSKNLFLKV